MFSLGLICLALKFVAPACVSVCPDSERSQESLSVDLTTGFELLGRHSCLAGWILAGVSVRGERSIRSLPDPFSLAWLPFV